MPTQKHAYPIYKISSHRGHTLTFYGNPVVPDEDSEIEKIELVPFGCTNLRMGRIQLSSATVGVRRKVGEMTIMLLSTKTTTAQPTREMQWGHTTATSPEMNVRKSRRCCKRDFRFRILPGDLVEADRRLQGRSNAIRGSEGIGRNRPRKKLTNESNEPCGQK